jgi:PAS domain S-box-containing protein
MTERLRILVIDDDQVDRMAVRRALRAGGVEAQVEEVADVAGALAALQPGAFDCVFLDFQLPGGDGLRVLREARAAGITTPMVMLTGQRDDKVAVELMKAGASDYLIKDELSPELLSRTLHGQVRLHQAEEQTRLAVQALRESEARFRILHETSPDGFMIFRSVRDAAGGIVDFVWDHVNPAAERITGRSAEELQGRRLLELMPGNREVGLFDLYREVVETGEPRQTELRYQHEGMDLWVRVTAARLADGFAVSFTDITRRRQAEEEREAALAARNRFYAAMSHELRTPINAIIGYTDLLLVGAYGPLGEKQLEGINRAHRAGQHLLELVNDILDLSKLEAGKLEIVLEPTRLPDLIDDLFTTLRPLAEERGSELRLVSTDCGDPIVTDPRRVRQILINLISNAIKFGESRPVDVLCRAGEGETVVVDVVDHGIGIAADDLSRIFEEFVQLDNVETRPGTGLGLPISRRLAGLIGGSLEVESAPGRGSTFRLILPNTAPDPSLVSVPEA